MGLAVSNLIHSLEYSQQIVCLFLAGRLGAPSDRKRVIDNPLVKYPSARELWHFISSLSQLRLYWLKSYVLLYSR